MCLITHLLGENLVLWRKLRMPANYAILLLFGAVFAACCVGVCPLMDVFGPNETGAVFVYFCFGAIGAAVALFAIWGVLWSQTLRVRALVSLGVGFVLFGCWFVGFVVSSADFSGSYAKVAWIHLVTALLCLPLFCLAIQSPLWFVRLFFRWDIALMRAGPSITVGNPLAAIGEGQGEGKERASHVEVPIRSPLAEPQNVQPLTIRDMLVTTAVIGFALAGARLAISFGGQNVAASEAEFWMGTGAALAACIGLSLASTLPIVVATLRARRQVLAMFIIGAYSAFALAITFAIIGVVEPSGLQLWPMLGICITVFSFVALTTMPLLVWRRIGFRLRWGRESARNPERAELSIACVADSLAATSSENVVDD